MVLIMLLVLLTSACHSNAGCRCGFRHTHDKIQIRPSNEGRKNMHGMGFEIISSSSSRKIICGGLQDGRNPLVILAGVLLTSREAGFPRQGGQRHLNCRANLTGLDRRHISEDPLRRRLLTGATLAASIALTTPKLPALAVIELSDEKQLIVDAWAVIQRAYVDPTFNGLDWKAVRNEYLKPSYRSMEEARIATAEMLGRLGDKYTKYITPKAYEYLLARFEAGENEPFGEIGISVARKGADGIGLEVTGIAENKFAGASDLRIGDIILTLDGKELGKGTTVDVVYSLLLGPIGSTVMIEYRRPDESGSRQVTLQRVPIRSGDVQSKVFSSASGSVGVVTLPDFEEGSRWFNSFKRSLEEVRHVDRLVLDLRGNLGGHFPTGVEAARLFLPKDRVIVSPQNRFGERSPYDTTLDGSFSNLGKPVDVLVDKRTASAAEVFVAALQENDVANVIGEGTFGKGLVQTIAKVSDGGAVVCTTAKYITPKGHDINGVGVVPDVVRACPTTKQAIECI